MSDVRLIVALDLSRHQYVCAPIDPADPVMDDLRARSYRGDRTLVCALCYAGVDAAPGTEVPLVVKGHIGGVRRPHFAHPSGRGPVGGQHEPESEWHLASKEAIAAWARTQHCVSDVRSEVWLPNRERRSDVRVVFVNGREVAFEVQGYRLSDADWIDRHRDYQRNQVIDVWLWHPHSPVHRVVLNSAERSQQLWMLDPWSGLVTLMVGAPHQDQSLGSIGNVNHRVEHLPPCTGDSLIPYEFPLSDLTLTSEGIEIPTELTKQLADALEQERRRVQKIQNSLSRIDLRADGSNAVTSSSDAAREIETSWPAIRQRAARIAGTELYTLLVGASVVRLDGGTIVLSHRLAQRLEQPKYLAAVRSAIQEVHGHAYDIRWVDRAPREAKKETDTTRDRQRFRIRAGHVQDFDTVFDLLRMAGARYVGDEREFVIEGSMFTFQQVWALLELIRHPEQPQVESLWQPDPSHESTSPG